MNIPTEIFSHLSHNNPPTSVTSIMNTLQAPRVRYKLSPKKIIRGQAEIPVHLLKFES
ncbi:hypothetical protein IMSAGC014_00031 [Bacteroidaceae bacterium]|nr:hypothetical protein IMSAGC014_00031 [Bacteroidaceae bacterium]